MKRISTTLFVLVSVSLAAVLIWQLQDNNRDDENTRSGAAVEREVTPGASNLSEPSSDLPTKAIWSIASADEATVIPGYPDDVKGAVKIRFDPVELRRLAVGDVISIRIPQNGIEYQAKIDSSKIRANEIRIVSAHSEDPALKMLLTIGRVNTFAHVNTPEGSFELVGNTEVGWFMNSANMDQHVDYSKPDYVVPEKMQPPREGCV